MGKESGRVSHIMEDFNLPLDRDILQLQDHVIRHRRWLHRHPQTGFREEDARDYILRALRGMHFDRITVLAGTGIKAVLRGTCPVRTLAFRADMDALAVPEKTGLEFASEYDGFMHACGHDGHMAMLLGFAQWLSENRDRLKDNVVLLFQPSEESVGGASPMIREGALDDPEVDAIFGYHIMPEVPQGKVGLKAGPLMASTCEFGIDIMGKSAHGAMPQKGIDAILAASYYITMLQGILTRKVDPLSQALITVGKLEAGQARNVLASRAHMEGILRTFDSRVAESVKHDMMDLLAGLERSFGVTTDFRDLVYYPPVVNDPEWTARVKEILPGGMFYPAHPLMIAEDFAWYQQKVPGVFLFLGSRNEELGYIHPLHSDRFQFDEEILLTGIQLDKNILLGLGGIVE